MKKAWRIIIVIVVIVIAVGAVSAGVGILTGADFERTKQRLLGAFDRILPEKSAFER